MAEHTVTIGAANENPTFFWWSIISATIPVSLLVSSVADNLVRIDIARTASTTFGFSMAGFSSELTEAVEDNPKAFTLSAGSLSVDYGGPNAPGNVLDDTTEPYSWRASADDFSNIQAFANAYINLTAAQKAGTTLTIRDFVPAVPAAPAFADDTGDDADWTRNTAINAITIPRATGSPAPTYASVGDEPAGIDIVLPTETADGSITGTPTAVDSGDIVIRATNSEGSDDWTQPFDTVSLDPLPTSATFTGDIDGDLSAGVALSGAPDLAASATFDGDLDGDLSAGAALGAMPLVLADSDDTGLEVDCKALLVASAAGTAGNFIYEDADRGGTDTPLDGELGLGADETVISGIRRRTATLFQLNDNNSPTALDIGAYFSAGGAGNDLTIYLRTLADGEVSFPATSVFSRIDQVRFTLPADAQALLDNVATGDRLIFKTARLPTLSIDAAFDGDLAGDLAPGVELGEEPFLEVDTDFTGGLTGDLAAGVGLGHIPLPASADFTGELAGDLAPSVALGSAPGPHQVFDLGANPFDSGADWLGALLLDPVFVVGGGTAYLRRFGISGNSTRLDVSESDTGSFVGAGPELVTEWEDWEGAIVFDADAGGITLKGPNHPDNSFSDPSEPYFWTPDNGAAFRDWYLTEPQNVTLRFNLAPAPDPVVADAAFTGELDGDLAAAAELGTAPDLALGAAFTGDLDGDLAAGVDLLPRLLADAAFDGALDGELAAGVARGVAPILSLGAAFDGELDGELAGDILLSGALLVLANFDQSGLDMEWLAVFEAPDPIGGGHLFAQAPRPATGTLIDGEVGMGSGDDPLTRITIQGSGTQLRIQDSSAFSFSTEYGAAGALTNRRFYVQTPDGVADWAFDGNTNSATSARITFDIPAEHQPLIAGIVAGTRFIMGFGNLSPLPADAEFTGELAGDLGAALVLGAAPDLAVGAAFDGDLAGDLGAALVLGAAPDLAVGAAFDGDLTGDLGAALVLGAAPDLAVGAAFDGDLAGDLAAGVDLGSPPALTAAAAFQGDLDGELGAAVALGPAPLETDVAFQGDLDGDLAAGVALASITADRRGIYADADSFAVLAAHVNRIRIFDTAGVFDSSIILHADNDDPISLTKQVGTWWVLDASGRVFNYTAAGVYSAAASFALVPSINSSLGGITGSTVGTVNRLWIVANGALRAHRTTGAREAGEDIARHADNDDPTDATFDGTYLSVLDPTARKVFFHPIAGGPAEVGEIADSEGDQLAAVTANGIGVGQGRYWLARPDGHLESYRASDFAPVGDVEPIPWEDIRRLTFSRHDGDGVNRTKMYQSPDLAVGNLITPLRRETADGFIQVGFQQDGAVTDNGDGTFSFPVTRSAIAEAYDEGTINNIVPDLAGDYDLLLLLPDLPQVTQFPSSRNAVWLWYEADADLAAELEDLPDEDDWPEAATLIADEITPGDNKPGDVVTLYRGSIVSTRGWDETAGEWVTINAFVDGNLFVTGTINTSALAAQSVTAPKILIGAGLLAGDDDSLTIGLGDNSLELGPDGISLRSGADSGLIVGPGGVAIDVADSSIAVGPDGISLSIDGGGGLALNPSGIGIVADGSSLIVGPGGIALQAGASSGLLIGPAGVAVGAADASIVVGAAGVSLNVAGTSGLLVGPNGVLIDVDGNGLSIGPNGISLDVDGAGGLTIGSAGIGLVVEEGGGLLLGPDGVALGIDGNGLLVGPNGLSLSVAGAGGLVIGSAGVSIRAAANSGLSIGPGGVGIDVSGNGLAVTAAGIALVVASGAGLSVGPQGVEIAVDGNGLAVGPGGIGLQVASGSGLFLGPDGLEVEVSGSNITVGPNGISITVDEGPTGPPGTGGSPGDDGQDGDDGAPGPPGPSITLGVGNAALSIANNVITLRVTGSGLSIGPNGLAFDGSAVPRVWTRLFSGSTSISTGSSFTTINLPGLTGYDMIVLSGTMSSGLFGSVEIPVSDLQTSTTPVRYFYFDFNNWQTIYRNGNSLVMRRHSGSSATIIKKVWGVDN